MVVLPQNTFLASKKFTTQGFPKPEALSLYLIAVDMVFFFCDLFSYFLDLC